MSLETIKFILEWDALASTKRQFFEDRDALYSRFPSVQKIIPFKHQMCEAIVVNFLNGHPLAAISSLRTHHNPEDYLVITEMAAQRQEDNLHPEDYLVITEMVAQRQEDDLPIKEMARKRKMR
jgi:hypothetical protein